MTLNLNFLRSVGFNLLAVGVLPLLRLLLGAVLRLAPPTDFQPPAYLHEQYDFVVVGGGSAGSVLASRLSEEAAWRVLLVETGPPQPPDTFVPAFSVLQYLPGYPNLFRYETIPQQNALINSVGQVKHVKHITNTSFVFPFCHKVRFPFLIHITNDAKCYQLPLSSQAAVLLSGRVLGGSSSVNGMLYSRGNKRDYDGWEALGNPGWGYESVLPYFIKSEDLQNRPPPESERFHGSGGPLGVTQIPPMPMSRQFVLAGQQLGYKVIDPAGPEQLGFPFMDAFTIRGGMRSSTADAFLRPAASRPNLHVLHSATVTQILFDKKRRAKGVLLEHKGKEVHVAARREVVLSAGALGSPHLLLLSGVGPSQHLREHKVKVVRHLPGVGQNLHDHVSILGLTWIIPQAAGGDAPALPYTLEDFTHYIESRDGALARPPADVHNAWVKASPGGDPLWPDIQMLYIGVTFAQDYGIFTPAAYNLDAYKTKSYFGEVFGAKGFSIRPILLHPKSRGSLTLRSRDLRDPPVVDLAYLSHPDDVATLVDGIKLALALGNTSALRHDLGATFFDKPLPECASKPRGSDAYWSCYVRHMSSTFLHLGGSCKMGNDSDPLAVVDHRLRVRGVSGLRVVDASVMPFVTSGNTNAAVIMVAERAADLIKQRWRA
ncbi:glucose dehydrogenase [FAD, quinone]-like isoform X1 [Eriocheir sinensis]|uniref:glucose dehydrogenase [FAD, quinone]-like isoform X1 n=1 Tax=Eriocheir sinensis TaxID=95602 RepID=UPI0021C77292|nr:glucose dehydrogenase [FAD, quinone]-like isoform X1 [Eriocheir sinensis]